MANPTLKFDTDSKSPNKMTLNGVLAKLSILLLLILSSAVYMAQLVVAGNLAAVNSLTLMGCFGGFGVAIGCIYAQEAAWVLAPIYALLEGLALGGIAALLNAKYPGIALQACGLTLASAFSMLAAYRSGLIKPTETFYAIVISATGGICLMYLAELFLQLAGITFIVWTPLSIGISLFTVTIASLNLVIDFNEINTSIIKGASKTYEWYAAFSVTVTLVWLYLEMLNLLAKLKE